MDYRNQSTFTGTQFSKTTDNYFYGGMLRKLHVQFAALFSELKVAIGRNDYHNGEKSFIVVPIKIASRDRVVAAIKAGNTQNRAMSLPALTVQMTTIEPAWDFVKGSGQNSRHTVFPEGSAFPDGGNVVNRRVPFPYMLGMELTILASNEHQHQQILEQILMLFNPDTSIQLSDSYDDWAILSTVSIAGIGLDPTIDTADSRVITTTLSFTALCYMAPPANITSNYIQNVKLRISELKRNTSYDDFFFDEIPGDPSEYDTILTSDLLKPPE